MRKIFLDNFWEEYNYWVKTDIKILKKINELIKGVTRNPYSGLGKPEPLRYQYFGAWYRRITSEHRLIYKVKDGDLYLIKCRFHYD